jgi:ubiquinone/menaquinone biosynthesis C-methylase UbiE
MLDEARENLAGERNVTFHRASGFHLSDFPDASFDLVYAHDVFVTFDLNQALALLDEAHRTLRAAGHLVVSFYTIDRPHWAEIQLETVRRAARSGRFSAGHPRAYTAAQVDAMCEAVGLRVVAATGKERTRKTAATTSWSPSLVGWARPPRRPRPRGSDEDRAR